MLEPGTSVFVNLFAPPGHVRTPFYLRGKRGVIERALGDFPNPEALAYGQKAESLPLYRVRFTASEVFGAPEAHEIDAEIYAHWLREA